MGRLIGVTEQGCGLSVKSQGLEVRHCGGPSRVHGSCGCVPSASPVGVSIWLPALEHARECEGSQPSAAGGGAAAGAAGGGVFALASPGELSASCAFSLVSIPAHRTRPHCSELGD